MSQPTIPVCYRHPSRETYLRCSRCDRPICPDCMHDAAVGHHCPECVGAARRTRFAARTAFGGTLAGHNMDVTKVLIGLNVAVFLLLLLTRGNLGWGALVPGVPGSRIGLVNGEYYRLITSMFLHAGLLHLALNMFALWVVGGVLEPLLGRARFLALYLVSGLGGGVAVYLTAGTDVTLFGDQPLFGGLLTPTVGASGAVFGLFGAFYVVLRRLRRNTSTITMILAINLIFTFVLAGQISVAGHLGGLVTGSIIGAGLAYAPRQHRTAVQAATVGGMVLLLIVLTALRTASLT
ncbi:MAG: rhomboid family intramembrane serine protease [Micromonosporaceae bacterium]